MSTNGHIYLEDRVSELEKVMMQLQRRLELNPASITLEAGEFDIAAQIVTQHSRVSWMDLIKRRQFRHITWPRQILFYLAHEKLELSLNHIGVLMAGRDHKTILHGINVVKDRMATCTKDRLFVEKIVAHLKDSLAQRNGQDKQPALIE